ncbi:MAG TPA: APC family permease [Gaiellaceae bacterium]|jgi:amino acid transporter
MGAATPGAASAAAARVAGKGLFLRNSTGLVRELGARDVFFINFLNIGAIVNFAIFLGLGIALFPGANMWVAALTGVFAGMGIPIVFAYLAGAMPRSGGDYVFISRTLGATIGFIVSWTVMVQAAFWPAYASWSLPSWVVPDILGPLGKWEDIGFFTTIANNLPKHTWQIVFGLASLALAFWIGQLGLRWIVRLQAVSVILGFVVFAITIPWALASSKADFTRNFDSFAHQYGSSAAGVLAAAQRDGYTGVVHFSWSETIAFWPFILVLTSVSITSIALSGEIRRAGRSQMIGTVTANALAGIMLALFMVVVLSRVDRNMLGAIGYFSFIGGDHNPFPYPLYGHVVVGILTGSPFLTALFGFAVALNLWVSILVLQAWSTRYLFAWAFDRMFPPWAASVSGRRRSPRNALVVVALIGVLFLFLLIYVPEITFANFGLLQAAELVTVGIVGIIFPWRLPELYRATASRKLLGIPAITIGGAATFAFMVLMIYYYVTNDRYGATADIAWKLAIGILASGVVFYIAARVVAMMRGIDVAMTYREIPPE